MTLQGGIHTFYGIFDMVIFYGDIQAFIGIFVRWYSSICKVFW